MELVKESIQSRLASLNCIAPSRYSAMDLHSQRRHLMERVQRKENKRYQKSVESQKKKLKTNLVQIDSYYAALKAEQDRRVALLADYNSTLGDLKIVTSVPTFQPINLVVPKPGISLGLQPTRKLSRLYSRNRLRGSRRI